MCSQSLFFSSSVFRQKRSAHKTHTHFPLYFHLFNIFFILPPFPIQHFPTAAARFEQTSLLTEFQLTVECEAAARDENCTANEISTRRARRRDFSWWKFFFPSALFSVVFCNVSFVKNNLFMQIAVEGFHIVFFSAACFTFSWYFFFSS